MKSLHIAAKAVWILYQLVSGILNTVKGLPKILRDHREKIVLAIQKAIPSIGLERASRLVGISTHQFHSWRNKYGCSLSPLHLCRRGQPHQLTGNEAASIRKYFSLPQFLHWSGASIYYQMIREKAAAMSLSTFYTDCGQVFASDYRYYLHREQHFFDLYA